MMGKEKGRKINEIEWRRREKRREERWLVKRDVGRKKQRDIKKETG